MHIHESKYNLGDMVYLVTESDQNAWQVIQVTITPSGNMYYLSCGTSTYQAYEIEVSGEKNILKSIL